jgi:lipooligosaccharide transport system permease protein
VLAVAQALPLYHGVQLVRPLVAGNWPTNVPIHIAVLLAYAVLGYAIALYFARRRFSA